MAGLQIKLSQEELQAIRDGGTIRVAVRWPKSMPLQEVEVSASKFEQISPDGIYEVATSGGG